MINAIFAKDWNRLWNCNLPHVHFEKKSLKDIDKLCSFFNLIFMTKFTCTLMKIMFTNWLLLIFLFLSPTIIITCLYFKIIKKLISSIGPFLFLLVVIACYHLTIVQQKLVHGVDIGMKRERREKSKNNKEKYLLK